MANKWYFLGCVTICPYKLYDHLLPLSHIESIFILTLNLYWHFFTAICDISLKHKYLGTHRFVNFLFYSVITSYCLRMNSIVDKKDPYCFGGRLAYPGVRTWHVMWNCFGIFGLFVLLVNAYSKSSRTLRAIVNFLWLGHGLVS